MTEDEMVGWHHQLNGHESEQTPGGGEGQGGPVCCGPWRRKGSVMTERLSNPVEQVHIILRSLSNGLKAKFTLNYY